jgi:two-component system CheB/CheR fusion protein
MVDVPALLGRAAEAVRSLMADRMHELTVLCEQGGLRVEADPTRLEQVLFNLLHNAAKYTDRGGHVWLTAGREGAQVVLRVRDTGTGIDPAMLPAVFDPLVQAERRLDRSQGGVGIGLALVRKLAELHGGTAEAFSEGPGRGSEFAVRLPAPAGGPRTEAGDRPQKGPGLAGPARRVLVVDDNRDAADSLGALLGLAGQDVRVVYDGPSALALAATFRPEVAFLDVGMPGMDGHELARRLRREPGLERAVLVALTGWGQEEDRRRTRDAGFDHHLVKPASTAALQQVLAEVRPPLP